MMHLIGNAMVKYQNVTLFADTINYTIDDALLSATGKPQLVEGADTTVGETMLYNMKTKRGRVKYASTHMDDALFQRTVRSSSPTKTNCMWTKGDYTTCAYPDTPHYYFSGKNIKLIPEDKIISRPVVLSIGDAPVAYLPYFFFRSTRTAKAASSPRVTAATRNPAVMSTTSATIGCPTITWTCLRTSWCRTFSRSSLTASQL